MWLLIDNTTLLYDRDNFDQIISPFPTGDLETQFRQLKF